MKEVKITLDENWNLVNAKLCHIVKEDSDLIASSINVTGIAAWSLGNLRPADASVANSISLENNKPIFHRARRLPPKNIECLPEELDEIKKMVSPLLRCRHGLVILLL